MDEPSPQRLAERVALLEAEVAALRDQVQRLSAPPREPEAPRRAAPPKAAPPRQEKRAQPPPRPASRRAAGAKAGRVQTALKNEDWLSRLGIALLLIGLAFLFKFGIDRGWLTPPVRILFGVGLGVFLLAAGLRLRPTRRRLGQVLLGGGIATFYVTLFAAFQLYSLVAYPVAFAGMVVVTSLGFVLAVQQKDAVLAVIATLGGLATPFLLYTDAGSIPGLVLYTCLILATAGSLYFYRGWRSLLLTTVLGGWLVMLVPWFQLQFDGPGTLAEKLALQAGLGFCWLVFGVVPALREVWQQRDPQRWAAPSLKAFKRDAWIDRPALTLVVLAPLVTWGLSRGVWDMPGAVWSLIAVGFGGLYVGAYLALRQRTLPHLASAHGVAAALVVCFVWFELFDEPWQWMLGVAAEALALHVLARVLPDRPLRLLGHLGGLVVAFWLAGRLLDLGGQTPVLVNTPALADLTALALLFGASWTLRHARLVGAYRVAAYVGLLGWLWRDLVALPNGQAYVSIAWGLCALALLVVGWRNDHDGVRNAGVATLLVVVAKLFIVDLAKLEAVWRILLFLGFGGLLLLLSYFFPRLWKFDAQPGEEAAAEQDI